MVLFERALGSLSYALSRRGGLYDVPGGLWGASRTVLAASGGFSDASGGLCEALGRCCRALGRLWGVPGALWEALGRSSRVWEALGHSWRVLGRLWDAPGGLWGPLGRSPRALGAKISRELAQGDGEVPRRGSPMNLPARKPEKATCFEHENRACPFGPISGVLAVFHEDLGSGRGPVWDPQNRVPHSTGSLTPTHAHTRAQR